jgi:hypothetical protein
MLLKRQWLYWGVQLLQQVVWRSTAAATSGLAIYSCCNKWFGDLQLLQQVVWRSTAAATSGLAFYSCCNKWFGVLQLLQQVVWRSTAAAGAAEAEGDVRGEQGLWN